MTGHPKRLMFPARGERLRTQLYRVFFIDPGITGTGFAYFPELITQHGNDEKPNEPARTGAITPKKASQWQARVQDLCAWLDGLCSLLKPSIIVIEWPEVWGRSAKSMASATRGDLGKLFYLVGGLGEVARRTSPRLPVLISAREWKGQLSKKAVGMRIKRRLNLEYQNHEEDAVGMGLAAQGLL